MTLPPRPETSRPKSGLHFFLAKEDDELEASRVSDDVYDYGDDDYNDVDYCDDDDDIDYDDDDYDDEQGLRKHWNHV